MKSKSASLLAPLLLILALIFSFTGCGNLSLTDEAKPSEQIINYFETTSTPKATDNEEATSNIEIEKEGSYSKPEEVAEYIRIYSQLPKNYITKKEATSLGWDSQKGNLWDVANGMSIGGDVFGNREGKLPKEEGRRWYECDVNYSGGFRGSERLVYSNDGLIYYTKDHYQTFTDITEEMR